MCEGVRGSIELASAATRRVEDLELKNNNFVVKMEDKMWIKNACLYRKTGMGKSTNTKEQKVGIQETQSVFTQIKNYSIAQNIL